jgi:hypothetical protein
MTGVLADEIHLGDANYRPAGAAMSGGFETIDGERFAVIHNVDRMPPFLMNVVTDSDLWLFAGSNGPFTAGRRNPDMALFPYQTVDKILGHADTSGARTILLVTRGGRTSLWEPWSDAPRVYKITRNLFKSVNGTSLVFEEINHDLGVHHRAKLSGCDEFGLVRDVELANLHADPVGVRYLDGWHQLIPPGVSQEVYARYSYLAAAYMRHERVPGTSLAIFTLNAAISDRPEPSESLRAAVAWSVGHPDPVVLLGEGQVAAFLRGEPVEPENEIRGEMGAYLVADRVDLEGGARHAWSTVGDTGLDNAAIVELLAGLAAPATIETALRAAVSRNCEGIRRRVASADALQQTADEAATAHHVASVLYNSMRGGTFDGTYSLLIGDVAAYLRGQNRAIHARHADWLAHLPSTLDADELQEAAAERNDPHLSRLLRTYLPLTFSRRHGDPSRPWNRFDIRLKDERGDPLYWYEGNWRDIFQNWEALGQSFPGVLGQFIAVFLNASTADGYNPYRITRDGADWEVPDPSDPWSHIGYWGDHQVIYLLHLLESRERHEPGALAAALGDMGFASTQVPYRIAGFRDLLADPRHTITFDEALHEELVERSREVGSDGKLLLDENGEVRLASLCEKLLVPLLVKVTNLVPGGGIWMNTQRPEWNDANNALAGWGLSVVTVAAIRRYLEFLSGLVAGDGTAPVSACVVRLMEQVTSALQGVRAPFDDETRFAIMARLGEAGEEHRAAVYAGRLGERVSVSFSTIRSLIAALLPAIEDTLRVNRRPDGLYHGYNTLSVGDERAAVEHLALMLEGQVAILESGLLTDEESLRLLRALRASDLYREDQRSYLLYPDHRMTPFLARNTLDGPPPVVDARLFAVDQLGKWHFQADLSTLADVERVLDRIGVDRPTRAVVADLWRTTFAHREFTGRSGRFFMFEGLGSIFWHMASKYRLAVQGAQRRAIDPAVAAELTRFHDEARDGLGFGKTAQLFGAFPMDPHSHSPRHRGAQQPGMTGQAKEDILGRFGELGVEAAGGHLRFDPRLLQRSEFIDEPHQFSYLDLAGREQIWQLPGGSLAFTYCQVPICYCVGDAARIDLDRSDGRLESFTGTELGVEASAEIFQRRGTYRRLTVTIPTDGLASASNNALA